MTIQEAIKSGKPFYRPVFADGEVYKESGDYYQAQDEASMKLELGGITPADILAEDWEVQE